MYEKRIQQLRREITYYRNELDWRYDELKVLREKDRPPTCPIEYTVSKGDE